MMTTYNPSGIVIRLAPEQVKAILAQHDEDCGDCVGYYANLDDLAAKVRSNTNWAMGSVFVYAQSSERFIVMKQIAPSSCEMLTISGHGVHDVLTAYRFSQEELVSKLQAYLDHTPVISSTTATRFSVSADGHTVFDSKTGLTWQRKHLSQMTWPGAIDAAVQANVANQFSHSDWRLPTRGELESLIDLTPSSGPKIDQEAFPTCPAKWFWTSDIYTPDPDSAWVVVFNFGVTSAGFKAYCGFVRLVLNASSD